MIGSRSLPNECKLLERIYDSIKLNDDELKLLAMTANAYNKLATIEQLTMPSDKEHIVDYVVEQGTRYGWMDRHLTRDESTNPKLSEQEALQLLDVLMRIEAYHNPRGFGALAPLRYLRNRQNGMLPEDAYQLPRL